MVRFKDKNGELDRRINRSINNSYKYTTFESVRKGFSERYIEAFASFLGASPFQFTLLVALPQFIGGIIQLFTTDFLNFFKSRKKLVFLLTLCQSLIWIPILFLAFSSSVLKVWYYILFIVLYFGFNLIQNPLWTSWIMDLVDFDRRGKYLSRTTKIFNLVTLISFVAGGFILNRAETFGSVEWTFAGLFLIAIISNLMAARFIKATHEPPYSFVRSNTSLNKFISSMREKSQGVIILYLSLMSFSVYISAGFFTPYVLQTLKFSYLYYVVLFSFPFVVKLLFIKRIGRAIDRFGPKKILKLISFMITLNPILWLFGDSFSWLIFVQIYAGLSYGAFEISSLTFFINETDSKNRVSLFAYYNFFKGIFIILGALSGNLFMLFGPFSNGFLNAFFWSGILRLLVLFIKFPKQVREKDRYLTSSYKELSKYMFVLYTPKDLMSKLVTAKEMISNITINKNDIITKLGNGEMVKIKRNYSVISNIPKLNIKPKQKKQKTTIKKKKSKKVAQHLIYLCNDCGAEFRRYRHSLTSKSCPYCASKKINFIRKDYLKKDYDSLRIKK